MNSNYGMASYDLPAQSPSGSSSTDDVKEEEVYRASIPPPPAPVAHFFKNRVWELEISQHPVRARMCGFGDKDRRPITPPPVAFLRVYEMIAGRKQEIDYNELKDITSLVVAVDLWRFDGTKEENTVKHATNAPTISSSELSSYPLTSALPIQPPPFQPWDHQYQSQSSYNRMPTPYSPYQPGPGSLPYPGDPSRMSGVRPVLDNQRQVSRNLIGTTATSCSKLKDEQGENGLYFVFQDLSVRTEGWFRLKFNLFSLVDQFANSDGPQLHEEAPRLATVFSQPFKVYSAKRFPGVIESTPLSKMLANQGIKIPVRKDKEGKKRKRAADEAGNSDGRRGQGDGVENGGDDDYSSG